MAGLKYRISGDVPITPAIAPLRHDFSPLHNAIAAARIAKEKRAEQERADKAAKAKQAADEALYNPGNVNDLEYQKSLQKKGEEVLNYSAEAYKTGAIGTLDHNYNINKMKQEAALIKGKADAALAEGTRSRQDIDKLPNYYNKSLLNQQVYDYMHPKDDKGDINWGDVDAKKIASVSVNPYHAINTVDMIDTKSKDWAQKIRKGEVQFTNYNPNDGTADGMMIKTDGYKTIFEKPVLDNKGNVVKWVPGVTDEAARFMMEGDHEINGVAEVALDDYIEAEVIARAQSGDQRHARLIYDDVKRNVDAERFKLDFVKKHLDRINKTEPLSELKQVATYTKPAGSGEDEKEFKTERFANQKRTLNVRKEGTNVDEFKETEIPEEIRFSGTKTKNFFPINTTKIYDEEANTALPATGDKQANITRVYLMGYDTKSGKWVQGKQANLLKNPNIVYKWVAGGTMQATEMRGEGEDAKEVKVTKKVFIPYEEINNDLKAEFGFDLNERDPSEISDIELTSFIKEKYPKSTPQEKLQIFKKIRGK